MSQMNQKQLWDETYSNDGRMWRGNSRIPLPIQSGRALDLGCGNGKTVSTLLDGGLDVTGIDFSSKAVESCRSIFGDKAEFIESDISDLPFDDSSFDYVTAVHILEHIDEEGMHQASDEIRRVLKPGGYLFIRSFAPGDLRESKRTDGILYIHRTPEQIVAYLPKLEVISSELVEERTRFGAVRCRSECLLRRI